MDTVTWVQIVDKFFCILHSANILGKGMNSTILFVAMGQIELFNLAMTTSVEEGKIWFQTC